MGLVFEKKVNIGTCGWRGRREPSDVYFPVDQRKNLNFHPNAFSSYWEILNTDLIRFFFGGASVLNLERLIFCICEMTSLVIVVEMLSKSTAIVLQ